MARLRPTNYSGGGFQTVRKVSNDSVSVGARKFTFDAVFDSNSTQVLESFPNLFFSLQYSISKFTNK